jgi:hypothetical protein
VFLEAFAESHPVDLPEVVLDVPGGFTAVCVGELAGVTTEGDRARFTWRAENVELRDVQCTAGRFAITRDGQLAIYARNDEDSRRAADDILAFAQRLARRYEADYGPAGGGRQLHILQMPRYGDIASGNVVGIADQNWRDFDPGGHAGATLAHEMVHAYVQVPVPREDPLCALVVEGFPSYFHLPVLDAVLAPDRFDYDAVIERRRTDYERRRATGRDRRGNSLPAEKPITAITFDEIGAYKDCFVLNDRVVLFLDDLRRRLGEQRFLAWTRELVRRDRLDTATFYAVTERLAPKELERVRTWIETTRWPIADGS